MQSIHPSTHLFAALFSSPFPIIPGNGIGIGSATGSGTGTGIGSGISGGGGGAHPSGKTSVGPVGDEGEGWIGMGKIWSDQSQAR